MKEALHHAENGGGGAADKATVIYSTYEMVTVCLEQRDVNILNIVQKHARPRTKVFIVLSVISEAGSIEAKSLNIGPHQLFSYLPDQYTLRLKTFEATCARRMPVHQHQVGSNIVVIQHDIKH